MEESAENKSHNNNKYDTDNNNEVTENCDISNSDPIPSLLLPIKKMKQIVNPISYIFSSLQNKNLTKSQIQIIAQSKISAYIINQTLQKHNSSPEQKNIMLINDLIDSKETHFIATFKDYLIRDYQEEFLRRYFYSNEITEVLPKFYQYYKNYLRFFCKGTFCDFDINEIMQEYGESQAEFYYNRNYGHKEKNKRKDKKENIDENNENENNDNENDENDDNNMENESDLALLQFIFTKSIEKSIERVKNSYNLLEKEKNEEISNIKPFNISKENTLILPDNSTVSSDDIITKENSIRYIIDLMSKKKKRINLNKRTSNQKKNKIIKNSVAIFDNKNKKPNEINKNNSLSHLNKKSKRILSKTTSNLNVKNTKRNKTIISRNKSNSIKPNYFTNTNNYKNRNNPAKSNYKKYIDILNSNKPKNKSSEPRRRKFQDESWISSRKTNPSKKARNFISSLNNNDLVNHFSLLSNNKHTNNLYANKNNVLNNNKANSSLFLLNNVQNIEKNNKIVSCYNYNTLFPMTMPKINISKNKHNQNISKKIENKENKNSKNKRKENYQNFNHNIKSFIKAIRNVSTSPKSLINANNSNNTNNGNNISNSNKSLSYSTVNNCNININNNIILSNNYFNNKNQSHNSNQSQTNLSSKKPLDKNMKYKKGSNSVSNNHKSSNKAKPPISRNNQNDLNRFKTDTNTFNSIGNNDNKLKMNKNAGVGSINQYKSFRKSNKNDLLLLKTNKLDKNKKYNNSNNHHRNFSLKNIPITIRNNLYNNATNTSHKGGGKLFEEVEINTINKTYKNLGIKKNSSNNHQKKIIFDYKRK